MQDAVAKEMMQRLVASEAWQWYMAEVLLPKYRDLARAVDQAELTHFVALKAAKQYVRWCVSEPFRLAEIPHRAPIDADGMVREQRPESAVSVSGVRPEEDSGLQTPDRGLGRRTRRTSYPV